MTAIAASRWTAARALLGALAVLATAACSEPALAPAGAVTLRTGEAAYVAMRVDDNLVPPRYTLEMVVAITNDRDTPIALQSCGETGDSPRFAVSMAAIPNDWSSAYENAWSCREPTTRILERGESRVDRIELIAPRTYDGVTGEALGDLEGRMRVVYFVEGRPLVSNAFDVRTDSLPR